MQYKVTFRTRKEAFAMSVDPDVGAISLRTLQKLMETIVLLKLDARGNILNASFFKQQRLNQQRKKKAKEFSDKKEIELQKKASMDFNSDDFND